MTAQNRQGRSIGPQVIFGLGVVVFGLLLTANNLGMGRFSVAIHFWPLVFTVLGFAILFERSSTGGRKLFGGALVVAGLWQTGVEAFGLHIYIDDYWPLILVAVGVLLVIRSLGPRAAVEDYTNMGSSSGAGGATGSSTPYTPYTPFTPSSSSTGASSSTSSSSAGGGPASSFAAGDEVVNAFAFMGGVRRNIVSPAFRRGNLTAIMGGVVLDMRQSQATGGETIVEVFAIWGGIEVKVPPDWQVVNEISPIMGGVEDRSAGTHPIRHRLVLKGVVLMAGVEVKS